MNRWAGWSGAWRTSLRSFSRAGSPPISLQLRHAGRPAGAGAMNPHGRPDAGPGSAGRHPGGATAGRLGQPVPGLAAEPAGAQHPAALPGPPEAVREGRRHRHECLVTFSRRALCGVWLHGAGGGDHSLHGHPDDDLRGGWHCPRGPAGHRTGLHFPCRHGHRHRPSARWGRGGK